MWTPGMVIPSDEGGGWTFTIVNENRELWIWLCSHMIHNDLIYDNIPINCGRYRNRHRHCQFCT